MFEKKSNMSENDESLINPLRPAKGTAKVHIGNGVKFKGEITQADEVQVDGEADVTLETSNLMVGGSGELKGSITSNNLDVWGKLEGEIKVNGTLTIQEQGLVEGKVEYQELHVKLGGKIKGELNSIEKVKKISEAKTHSLQDSESKNKADQK